MKMHVTAVSFHDEWFDFCAALWAFESSLRSMIYWKWMGFNGWYYQNSVMCHVSTVQVMMCLCTVVQCRIQSIVQVLSYKYSWSKWTSKDFKAALINIFFILTLDQMTVCNVKGVVCIGECTETYHPNLQLLSVLQGVLASLSSSF